MSGDTRAARRRRQTLVTGGAGFIGSHLVEALLVRGDRVTVLDDLSTGRRENLAHLEGHPALRLRVGSICDRDLVDEAMDGCDVVFHLAAAVGVELIVRDPVRVFNANVLGSHTVLETARRYRPLVLIASSSEIYGKSRRALFAEQDDRVLGPTTKARWSYSTSKAMGEYMALACHGHEGLPVVIFRLFNTVGERQSGRYGMVLPRFVAQALAGEPLTVYGDGRQRRTFCDVSDAVRAIISLAEAPGAIGGVFNVGSTEEITIADLARQVLAIVGGPLVRRTERLVHIPYDQAYAPGFEDLRRRVPDTTRIRELIGWQPKISLEETLARVVAERRARMKQLSVNMG